MTKTANLSDKQVQEIVRALENLAFHSAAGISDSVSDMQRDLTRKSIERAEVILLELRRAQ